MRIAASVNDGGGNLCLDSCIFAHRRRIIGRYRELLLVGRLK